MGGREGRASRGMEASQKRRSTLISDADQSVRQSKKRKSKKKKERGHKKKRKRRRKNSDSESASNSDVSESENADRAHATTLTPPDELISESHYYLKNETFKLWLKDQRGGVSFDELTSEQSHRLFCGKFCRDYNSGRWKTPISSSNQRIGYTNHKWKFASNMTAKDRATVSSAIESVSAATNYKASSPSSSISGRSCIGSRGNFQADKFLKEMGIDASAKIKIAPRPTAETTE